MKDSIEKQREVVARLCKGAVSTSFPGEIAGITTDYVSDQRVFLGVLAFPKAYHTKLFCELQRSLCDRIKDSFAIPSHALHFTIKNIRTIASPPNFSSSDVNVLIRKLSGIKLHKFEFSFIDYLATPTSIGVAAYADSGFRDCERLLDDLAREAGVPDNKVYHGNQPLFSNVTLLRLFRSLTSEDLEKAKMIPFSIPPVTVSSLYLVESNLSFSKSRVKVHAEIPLQT